MSGIVGPQTLLPCEQSTAHTRCAQLLEDLLIPDQEDRVYVLEWTEKYYS